jgi:hypothetical protein
MKQSDAMVALSKFPFVLTCACGDEWEVNPPAKFRTQAFADYTKAKWIEKHATHTTNRREIKQ